MQLEPLLDSSATSFEQGVQYLIMKRVPVLQDTDCNSCSIPFGPLMEIVHMMGKVGSPRDIHSVVGEMSLTT